MLVNLSGTPVAVTPTGALVRTTMNRHGIGAGELELEVTESVAMEDRQAIAQLEALRTAMGVELTLTISAPAIPPWPTSSCCPSDPQDQLVRQGGTRPMRTMPPSASPPWPWLTWPGLAASSCRRRQAQRGFLADHRCDILPGLSRQQALDTRRRTGVSARCRAALSDSARLFRQPTGSPSPSGQPALPARGVDPPR